MNNRPIGIFDSGVGGLTVAGEIINNLPNENFIYFGDTARNPYGTRSMEEISKFCTQIANFLLSKNSKAILIACNTATIAALETLTKKITIPVIGVVEPSIAYASKITKNNNIGIMATEGSIKSGIFQKCLLEINPDFKITATGCPDLVQMAENGIFNGDDVNQVIEKYLNDIKKDGCDTVILGCTHFPLFSEIIQQQLGTSVNIVNPALKASQKMKQTLACLNTTGTEKNPEYSFYTSSQNNEKFKAICKSILKKPECAVNFVNIDNY